MCVIARREAFFPRQRPNLQEVHPFVLRFVGLRVRDSAAACCKLDVASTHAVEVVALGAVGGRRRLEALFDHGIPVREFSREDVGENFSVAVGVRWEAVLRGNAVFIQDAEGPEGFKFGAIVVCE